MACFGYYGGAVVCPSCQTLGPHLTVQEDPKMLLIRIGLALVALLLGNRALGSDWQYAGYVKVNGLESHQFLDAETVSHPTKDVLRVWVKSIRSKDFDRFYKSHQKLVVERSARKIAAYYGPRFLELDAVKAKYSPAQLTDARVELTSYEVIANEPDIPTLTKLYFEIDCAGQRIKVLSGTSYSERGDVVNRGRITNAEYDFIAPDSNGQWLSQLLCTAK
jgi:hypothetical protein